MVRQVLIIFGCLLAGNLIIELSGIKLPASIMGLFLLLLLLTSGVVKPNEIKDVGHFFNKNIAFFFVPAGVAIMAYTDMITHYLWTVIISTVISIILVLVVSGWSHQILRKKRK